MSPAFLRFNATYGALIDSVITGYFSMQSFIETYSLNLRLCKLRCSASFATICRTVSYFVCIICRVSIPSQISKQIILTVSVIVATFCSLRFWANKRGQNQSMNSYHFRVIVFPQQNKGSGVFGQGRGLFYAPTFYGPNAAQIRNFVNVFKVRDCAPYFHTQDCGIMAEAL